jgi:hypothetical protein
MMMESRLRDVGEILESFGKVIREATTEKVNLANTVLEDME